MMLYKRKYYHVFPHVYAGVVFFFLSTVHVFSQNLAPNNGFEEGQNCPQLIGDLQSLCDNWYCSIDPADSDQPTPDWFHTCSEIDLLSPPNILWGFQTPAEGGGYAGIVTWRGNSPNYREIIGVELNQLLSIGATYLIEFKVSALDQNGNYALSNNLGFNFSTHSTYNRGSFPINSSHFSIDTVITLSKQWSQISTVFLADSAYAFFHLGNFYDDNQTTVSINNDLAQSAYYVIDEVQISEVLSSSNTSAKGYGSVAIYPNPVLNEANIVISNIKNIEQIVLYGSDGSTPIEIDFDKNQMVNTMNFASLNSGCYIIAVITKSSTHYERFIKL